jgi:hypothetical protein
MTFRNRCLSQGLVAFVDLLGFSSRVTTLRTTADIEGLERDLSLVQRWFEHRPTDELTRQSKRYSRKTVLAFSDCVVISVSLRSSLISMQGDYDVLMNELVTFALAQGSCTVNSIFIRGGVDLGVWYRNKDTLISPAMVGAYSLERAVSVPVIAISDGLLSHLSEHPHRAHYHESADPFERIFRQHQLRSRKRGRRSLSSKPRVRSTTSSSE